MKKPLITSGLGVAGLICLMTAVACIALAFSDKNPSAALLGVVLAFFGTDAVWFEITYAWYNGGLQDRYKLWKKRRFWNIHRQHEHLVTMLKSDNRWMAGNPIVDYLTERYLKALDIDWYTHGFQSSDKVRVKLGLEPNYSRSEPSRCACLITYALEGGGAPVAHIWRVPNNMLSRDVENTCFNYYANYRAARIREREVLTQATWTWALVDYNPDEKI